MDQRPETRDSTCIFGARAGCCAGKVECRRAPDVVRVLPVEDCAACPDRIERLRIGAVIIAHNEGAEVRRTVESLCLSIVDAELVVILVDDASTDGSCQFASDEGFLRGFSGSRASQSRSRGTALFFALRSGLRRAGSQSSTVVSIRHEAPQGVGRSRNAGWRAAREAGCHVVSFHDAHMRFHPITPEQTGAAPGGLEKLALRALQEDAFLCAGSAGYKREGGADAPTGSRLFGCDLIYGAAEGLQAKWRLVARAPEEEWLRSPCPMGAGYVLSARTAERLEAATGTLWEDTAGRWGFSEQAMAVKCFLLGVPVYFARDVVFRHMYRTVNPVPDAARQKWLNVCRATAVLFGRDVFQQRFRAWCVKWLGEAEVQRIVSDVLASGATIKEPLLHNRPDEVFTRLCRPGPAAVSVNPTADRGQIADQYLKDEDMLLAVAQSVTSNQTCPPSVWREPVVTVCLLNYARPENLARILTALAQQTVPLQVYLWNNGEVPLSFGLDGGPASTPIWQHPLMGLAAGAHRNVGCLARWQMAALAETEFVCSLDDDLAPRDPHLLELAIAACREECPDGIVGSFGWEHVDGRGYQGGRHVHGTKGESRRVDVVKGRFMLFRRELLARVPMLPPALADDGEPLGFRCDDIYVSLCIARGLWGRHVVPARLGRLGKLWREMGQDKRALAAQRGHYERRGRAVDVIRNWLSAPAATNEKPDLPALRVAGTRNQKP